MLAAAAISIHHGLPESQTHVLLLLVTRQQVGSMERPITPRTLELRRSVTQLVSPESMSVSAALGGEYG